MLKRQEFCITEVNFTVLYHRCIYRIGNISFKLYGLFLVHHIFHMVCTYNQRQIILNEISQPEIKLRFRNLPRINVSPV